jgi:acetyl-CoA C-acetyltransferase
MSVSIVGWAHTPFGKLEGFPDVETLIRDVTSRALADAEVEEVDGIHVGVFNNGFSKQDFPSSLVLQANEKLRFKPAVRVENACATGSAAIHGALQFIQSGQGKIALVVGAEKMTVKPNAEVGDILLGCCYRKEEASVQGGFTGVFAEIALMYFKKYGDQSDALAKIATKNHHNGVSNPYAQLRKDLGYDFCRTPSEKNPYVVRPLRRTDCSPVSDGAAALILVDESIEHRFKKAVRFRATAHINDYLPMSKRDMTQFEGASLAWKKALAEARVQVEDLSLVETHDCFTIAELIQYEAMGLTKPGCGIEAIEEGWVYKDGKLPVNPSGGLKSKGHPIGATGVSMHVLAAMQLTGAAGEMQIPDATLAGVFNMGGAAVANYVSILERSR